MAFIFNKKVYFYYLTFGLSGLSILSLQYVILSPFIYTLRAIRDNPLRAQAISIDVHRWQWIGFTFSSLFNGLAGGIFIYAKGSVFPTTLDIITTLDASMITLFGGINKLSGPIETEISRQTEFWAQWFSAHKALLVLYNKNGSTSYLLFSHS